MADTAAHLVDRDFLGFTLNWKRTRNRRWGMFCKTHSARLRRAIQSVYDGCRRHRHFPVTQVPAFC